MSSSKRNISTSTYSTATFKTIFLLAHVALLLLKETIFSVDCINDKTEINLYERHGRFFIWLSWMFERNVFFDKNISTEMTLFFFYIPFLFPPFKWKCMSISARNQITHHVVIFIYSPMPDFSFVIANLWVVYFYMSAAPSIVSRNTRKQTTQWPN